MASTDKPVPPEPEMEAPPPEPTAPDVESAPPPPPTSDAPPPPPSPDVEAAPTPPPTGDAPPPPPPPGRDHDYFRVVEVVLRLLLFAAAVVAVVVMVTGNQTKPVGRIRKPPSVLYHTARFKDSPALIYLVAALSVAGLYAIITTVASFLALLKPSCSTKLLSHFLIFDVLLLGIVASATGAAGAVAYIGIKGNSHTGWTKVCNVFGKFCAHVEASIAISLFASILLALLLILSAHSLSKKIPK